jgi:hypothetical protein
MKITLSQLRSLIREAVKKSIEDEEAVIPGRPMYDNPNVSAKSAQKIGDGGWPGGYLDEDEEALDEDLTWAADLGVNLAKKRLGFNENEKLEEDESMINKTKNARSDVVTMNAQPTTRRALKLKDS